MAAARLPSIPLRRPFAQRLYCQAFPKREGAVLQNVAFDFGNRPEAEYVRVNLNHIFFSGTVHAIYQPLPCTAALTLSRIEFGKTEEFAAAEVPLNEVAGSLRDVMIEDGDDFAAAQSPVERFYRKNVHLNIQFGHHAYNAQRGFPILQGRGINEPPGLVVEKGVLYSLSHSVQQSARPFGYKCIIVTGPVQTPARRGSPAVVGGRVKKAALGALATVQRPSDNWAMPSEIQCGATRAVPASPQTRLRRLAAAACIAAVLLSLCSAGVAARHRLPWSDEGWFSSASYNLAHRGFFGTTVLEPARQHLTRIDQRTYWVMPLFLLAQAGWYMIAPETIFWTRAFTIIWAFWALFAFWHFVAHVAPDPRLASLATSLLALSYIFIDNSAFARPDMMCLTLGLAGLAVYVTYRQTHFIVALTVSNGLVAASCVTHPNGVFHALGLLGLLVWFDFHRLSLTVLTVVLCPYGVAAAAWGVYIAQDPSAFMDQFTANAANNDRWRTSLNPFAIIANEIKYRYLPAFGVATGGVAMLKLFSLAAYIAGSLSNALMSRFRARPGTKLLLLLLVVYLVAMALFNQKLSYYLVHILPWYIALLAAWIIGVWDARKDSRTRVAVGVVLLICVEVGGIYVKAYQRSYVASQRSAMEFVKRIAQPGDRIVGSASLLYELNFDTRLIDDASLGLHSGRQPDIIVVDALYRIQYEAWKETSPRDMGEIGRILSKYRRRYVNGEYAIYSR